MFQTFDILPDPTPCPSRDNCYCFAEADQITRNCTLDHERERGANACDFVQWIIKPVSTFDAVEIVSTEFGIDQAILEANGGEK